MAKIKYVVRIAGQIVGTRTSDRKYTHAVVINGHDKTDHVATWCGRLDLAQAEQRKYQRYAFRAEIVAVEILAPKAPPAAKVEAIAKPAPAKPALCYVALETNAPGKRVAIVKRGELGYFDTDLDVAAASIEIVKQVVTELNARAMICGSMFGWNVAAANSDHLREARAEAEAIAAAHQAARR
jgi:hypothetical protein